MHVSQNVYCYTGTCMNVYFMYVSFKTADDICLSRKKTLMVDGARIVWMISSWNISKIEGITYMQIASMTNIESVQRNLNWQTVY